jgi:hypothetical protein
VLKLVKENLACFDCPSIGLASTRQYVTSMQAAGVSLQFGGWTVLVNLRRQFSDISQFLWRFTVKIIAR